MTEVYENETHVPGSEPLELVGAIGTDSKVYPFKVDPVSGRLLVDAGVVVVAEPLSIDDNGGSLTVDAGIQAEVTGSGSALNADVITSTDVSLYRWLSLQITGTFSGTITFQGSNDNTNFVTVVLAAVNQQSGALSVSSTITGIFAGPVNYKYFRARLTSYSSGTASGRLELAQSAAALPAIAAQVSGTVLAAQSGSWTEANSAAIAASLDDIETAVELIDDTVYTDGTGTPSKGVAVMGTDGTNPQILHTDSSGDLQVDVLSSALPSGAATAANQATEIASLSVLDDWDESDRAKVNLIVAQAGITGAAGSVAANTPRVTLASDDPAVTALGTTADATSSNTIIGRLKNLLSRWPSVIGQRTKADSLSVTFPSDVDTLPISSGITKSTVNSTATPLGIGGVFTGTGENISAYEEITVTLYGLDVAATGTLSVFFSTDGTNWDFPITFAVEDLTGFLPLPLRIILPFFYVTYTNGGTAQTAFRLTTVYHRSSSNAPFFTLDAPFAADAVVQRGQTVLAARNSAGTVGNVPRSDNGGLQVGLEALTGSPKMSQSSVTGTATQLAATPLTGRKTITFIASTANTKIISLTTNSGITAYTDTDSVQLGPGAALGFDLDDTYNTWYAISESGTQRVSWAEVS